MGADLRLAHRIPLPWPRTVVVTDAHMLMRAATRMYRFEESPLALQLATSGRARILVAPHIPGEVERGIHRLARHHRIPVEDVLAIWRSAIAPYVDVVELPPGEYLNPRLRPVRTDTDDVPTAALALFVAPCVVWSEDHSLVDTGLADPHAGPIAFDLARREADWAEHSAAAAFGVNFASAGISALVRAAARRPAIAVAGVAGLAAAAYLAELPARVPAELRRQWLRSLSRGSAHLLELMARSVAEMEASRTRLPAVSAQGEESPEEAAARVLASQAEPLLLRNLFEKLQYRRGSAELLPFVPPSMASLRRHLAASSTFVRSPGDRWSIGVPVPHWAGSV